MSRLQLLVLASLCSCTSIAGTEDLFICETCETDDEDGGGGSDAEDCPVGEYEVELTLIGGVVIEIDSTDEVVAASTTLCLSAGEQEFRASCAGDNDNAEVSWGFEDCDELSDRCSFTLSDDEEFTIDGSDACD